MLTVDLVRARRRGRDLLLSELKGRTKSRAIYLAELYLDMAKSHVGEPRGAFDESCATIMTNPRERKLALGFKKLVEDLCSFETDDTIDARELRRQVFLAASAARRELADGEILDDRELLEQVAAERGRGEAPEELVESLYIDLREAQLLREAPAITPAGLVEKYEMAQAQAVLLRATRVIADVRCDNPATYRYLFNKLKFRRLLHRIQRKGPGYRIEIDGPYSLFSSVTKYGIQLALLLPALQACDEWALRADLLWGKEKSELRFSLSGGLPKRSRKKYGVDADKAPPKVAFEEIAPEEVVTLVNRLAKKDCGWQIEPSTAILELPGVGLCVPDLRFQHRESGVEVFLEVLGFWSRDAVWKRVELVQAGLPQRIIFAVPKRLRVSEEVLEGDLPGELYVYKGVLSEREVLSRLDAMVAEASTNEGAEREVSERADSQEQKTLGL